MDKQGWISQLGRLYAEVSSVEGKTGAQEHADQFNRILSNLKEEFPENEFVQGTEVVIVDAFSQENANQEVKMKCGQLADALGYEIPNNKLESLKDVTVISVDTEQTAEQNVSQELSFEQTIELVNNTTLSQENKTELNEVVREFEDELNGEQDISKLRELLQEAYSRAPSVAANLGMLALQNGLVDVLNLA